MGMEIARYQVVLVRLDPTLGSEIKKTRPALVLSPDEMNRHISTVIVAPMTSKSRPYPSRVKCEFQGVEGEVVLDQIRTIDKMRVIRVLGRIEEETKQEVHRVIAELFAP